MLQWTMFQAGDLVMTPMGHVGLVIATEPSPFTDARHQTNVIYPADSWVYTVETSRLRLLGRA